MKQLTDGIEKLMTWLQRKPWATFLALTITAIVALYRQGIADAAGFTIERREWIKKAEDAQNSAINANTELAKQYKINFDLIIENQQLRADTARLNHTKP